jgi:hypothetical protein
LPLKAAAHVSKHVLNARLSVRDEALPADVAAAVKQSAYISRISFE